MATAALPSARISSEHDLDDIKATITQLTPAQSNDLAWHVRHLQNQNSPLLCLPPELRENIYDFVAVDELRERIFSVMSENNHWTRLTVPLSLSRTCRQLKAECSDIVGRSIRAGMIVEMFDNRNNTWRVLDAEEARVMGSVNFGSDTSSSPEAAREQVEGLWKMFASSNVQVESNGLVYFECNEDCSPTDFRYKRLE